MDRQGLLNELSHAASAAADRRADADADPAAADPSLTAHINTEPLSRNELLALGTFSAVFERRMAQLDKTSPPNLTQLLFQPPDILTRAMVRMSAPKLAQLLQHATRWRDLAPTARLDGSKLDVLPDLVISEALCFLPLRDLCASGLCCKALAAVPAQPFFFRALAGPFKGLFDDPNPVDQDEEASLIELSLMLRKCRQFCGRSLHGADSRAPGALLLLELQALPHPALTFDVFAFLCHARPQLEAERQRLRVLTRALAVLNAPIARAQLSAVLGVALALGTALAGIDGDGPKSFTLNSLSMLQTVKSRFHPDLTLADFLVSVAHDHHAMIDPEVAEQLECLCAGYQTLPRLGGVRTSIAGKVAEVASYRQQLRDWLREESDATMRQGVERYLWMLQLFHSELEDADRASRALVLSYCAFRQFIQGEADAPKAHPFTGHLIDKSMSLEAFTHLVKFASQAVAAGEAGSQQRRDEALATWARAEAAGVLSPKPDAGKIIPKFQSQTAHEGGGGGSGGSESFAALRASVAAGFNARPTANIAAGAAVPAESDPSRKLLRRWPWEPSGDAVSAAFAEAPKSRLTNKEVVDLERLFTRGTFVGMDLVLGVKAKEHFTMDDFTHNASAAKRRTSNQSGAAKSSQLAFTTGVGVTGGGGRVLGGFFDTPPAPSASFPTAPPLLSGGDGRSKHPLKELLQCKADGKLASLGVDPACLEFHLTPGDFAVAFKMDLSQFTALPKWRQANLKKAAGLW